MSQSHCREAQQTYNTLKDLKDQFDVAYEQARKTKDFLKVKEFRVKLEEKRDELMDIIDPHRVSLRRRLATTLDANYVHAFHDGVAWVQKNGRTYYIDKHGREITEFRT